VSDNRSALSNEAGVNVLEFSNLVVVGRSSDLDNQGASYNQTLQLDQTTVSSNRASLSPAPEGLLVTDLGSTNGTFINDQRLATPTIAVKWG